MQKNLTLVICVYNCEKYIKETLSSIYNQTYQGFKLLVIDDCSSDNSLDVVKEFLDKNKFKETEIVEFEENKGIAFIRNFALQKVTTSLMLFFDADDIAKPTLLEKLYDKINENNECIAVSCYSKYVDSNSNRIIGGQFIGPLDRVSFKIYASRGKLIFLLPPTIFKRKEAIEAGGYRLDGFPKNGLRYQDLSEDLDLWSRMSDQYEDGSFMITIPEALFYYRKNTNSLSASKESLIAMQHKIRYIKYNLKLRRKGLMDRSFIDYMEGISDYENKKNSRKDISAFYYRESGFLFMNKSYIMFLIKISLSIFYNPKYIVHKIKSNFIR